MRRQRGRHAGIKLLGQRLDNAGAQPRLGPAAEPFQAQAFVAEFAVEAFPGAILPGLARIDQRRGDALIGNHFKSARLTNSGPLSERR